MHWSLSLLQDSLSMKVLSEVVIRNREVAHDATSAVRLWTTKALQPTTDGHEANRENITMPTFKAESYGACMYQHRLRAFSLFKYIFSVR